MTERIKQDSDRVTENLCMRSRQFTIRAVILMAFSFAISLALIRNQAHGLVWLLGIMCTLGWTTGLLRGGKEAAYRHVFGVLGVFFAITVGLNVWFAISPIF